jgi:hypothetical protein
MHWTVHLSGCERPSDVSSNAIEASAAARVDSVEGKIRGDDS